jgi:putative pyrroloquinoline-quinone binding quinoprotein
MVRFSVRRVIAAVSIFVLPLALVTTPASSAVVPGDNWSAYLLGPGHSSFQQRATAITVSNADSLVAVWNWVPDPPTQPDQPPAQLFSSPTVVGGRVYIGAFTGWFYALDEATGEVIWKTFLGYQPAKTCPARGIYATATVAQDSVTRELMVYESGQDGYLYALHASDGTVAWKAFVADPGSERNEGLNWSSPTVIGGRIYVGMSSNCDTPLIRGGLRAFDQTTGDPIATYFTVPEGIVGGSIWSTAAVTSDGASVFVTTGNGDFQGGEQGDSFSIVRLSGADLVKQDIWTVPGLEATNYDFGASPTLFSADLGGNLTPMVGACNKNGNWYAWEQGDLAAGPVWQMHPGSYVCLAAAVWDGQRLFISSDRGGNQNGSIRLVDPATGATSWITKIPGTVIGTPTLNGARVLAVQTYDYDPTASNGVYLLSARTGQLLATISTGGDQIFAQPVFAGPFLFVAAEDQGLTAYTPSG